MKERLEEYNRMASEYAEQGKDFATENPWAFAEYVQLLNQSLTR